MDFCNNASKLSSFLLIKSSDFQVVFVDKIFGRVKFQLVKQEGDFLNVMALNLLIFSNGFSFYRIFNS
jgi:hypothetical protein